MSRLSDARALLEKRADVLRALEPNWDSYDGEVVNRASLDKAVELALTLEPLFSQPPQLVPCSGGDVQVEWHTDGFAIELFVAACPPPEEKK